MSTKRKSLIIGLIVIGAIVFIGVIIGLYFGGREIIFRLSKRPGAPLISTTMSHKEVPAEGTDVKGSYGNHQPFYYAVRILGTVKNLDPDEISFSVSLQDGKVYDTSTIHGENGYLCWLIFKKSRLEIYWWYLYQSNRKEIWVSEPKGSWDCSSNSRGTVIHGSDAVNFSGAHLTLEDNLLGPELIEGHKKGIFIHHCNVYWWKIGAPHVERAFSIKSNRKTWQWNRLKPHHFETW